MDFRHFLERHKNIGSTNTVESYHKHVEGYKRWFSQTKGMEATQLHHENIKEFVSHLRTVKRQQPKTVNAKLSALQKWNEFLIEEGVQTDMVVENKDYIKIQAEAITPAKLEQKDVEKFRQLILDHEKSKRNYAIVTILAYGGLRISECLGIKMDDYNLESKQLVVRGKGNKTRIVYMNDKITDAIAAWLKERKSQTDYLFVSNRDKAIDRTMMNKVFKNYSQKLNKEVTPHDLRHFFCSHCLNNGFSFHEVAKFAGHTNIQTTLTYAHPTMENILERMNQL